MSSANTRFFERPKAASKASLNFVSASQKPIMKKTTTEVKKKPISSPKKQLICDPMFMIHVTYVMPS